MTKSSKYYIENLLDTATKCISSLMTLFEYYLEFLFFT